MARLPGIAGLRRGRRHEQAGFRLYGAAVAAARESYLYESLGVPDTLDGRFDLVALHAFLLVHHLSSLPEPGPALAQAVFDAMFSDMDITLREMGVGDLVVGRRVRAMWEAFHGRSNAYAAAMAAPDNAALAQALALNVWRGAAPPDGADAALARLVRMQYDSISNCGLETLAAGATSFLPAEAAAR